MIYLLPAIEQSSPTSSYTTQDWLTASRGLVITSFYPDLGPAQLVSDYQEPQEPLFGQHIKETIALIRDLHQRS